MTRAPRRRRLRLADAGLVLALAEWGDRGPLVLLHHANGFCAGLWTPVAEALAGRHRVVAIDARGHGDSDRPPETRAFLWDRFVDDLVEVAARLAAEHPDGRVAVGVGHSFGGTATLAAAARRPELFGRLLLLDPVLPLPPGMRPDPDRMRRIRLMAATARRRRAIWPSRDEARASWARRRFFAGWDPQALDAYAAEGLRELPDGRVTLKCSPEVEATIFENSGSLDVFGLAAQVLAPTRILWARHGDFSRAAYEKLAAGMRAAEVVDADTGHLIPMQRPELVVAEIRAAAAAGE